MKRYFSPYMIQIIKLTKDWRDDFINQREFINAVVNVADTYEETMINYKKEESEEQWITQHLIPYYSQFLQ